MPPSASVNWRRRACGDCPLLAQPAPRPPCPLQDTAPHTRVVYGFRSLKGGVLNPFKHASVAPDPEGSSGTELAAAVAGTAPSKEKQKKVALLDLWRRLASLLLVAHGVVLAW
jgi:hypothetical protein